MSIKDLIIGILVGLGGASGIWGVVNQIRTKRLKKKILLGLLQNPKYKFGRTFGRLKSGVGDPDGKITRELLVEFAREEENPGAKPPDEVLWTLKPRS